MTTTGPPPPTAVDHLPPGAPEAPDTCEREPIHRPGATQPHGVLLAVDEGSLVVRQVSANSADHLGVAPGAVVGAPLARSVGAGTTSRLRASVADPHAWGGDPLPVSLPAGMYELTWHRSDGLLLVELQPAEGPADRSVSKLFQDVRHAMDALQGSGDVQAVCDTAAEQVRRLTGYDRVMVYRFHPDEHGEVVAESRADALEPYLGQHYPASDIPVQARQLYLLNHLRVVADVGYEPAQLVGDGQVLDLGRAGLRSVSPFHLAYLRAMGVQATLTISLLRGSTLWGMVMCHHGSPKRVGAQRQAACRLLGQLASLQVVAAEDRARAALRARLTEHELQLVRRMSTADDPAAALVEGAPSPLDLASADGFVARIDGRSAATGAVPSAPVLEGLLDHLRTQPDTAPFVSDGAPYPLTDGTGPPGAATGVLAVPLSAGWGDVLLWFRGEYRRTVTWGGNPDGAHRTPAMAVPGGEGLTALGPRRSFAAWVQEVRGRSRPWLQVEVDAVQGLADAVPELLLARARDRLAHLALHDPLTGLPNRGLLMDRLTRCLAHPSSGGRHVALLFVDLDRFKTVNDSLGHSGGDAVLRQAAGRLSSATRDDDTVARLGGDEFVVLCEGLGADRAQDLAARVVDRFRQPFVLGGHTLTVTASVGVAVAVAGDLATPAELLRDADTAMYRVKHAGRNDSAPFTTEMRATSLRRIEVETRLRPALERGELTLHFQPVHAATGGLCGFEALSRWPLAGVGTIPPSEFVPVAEATGLMAPLTGWALDTGLAALSRWRARPGTAGLGLSVNVSPVQVGDPRLEAAVDEALRRHGVPPGALTLEITEGAMLGADETTRRFVSRMRGRGVRLSIDDFGTGFSSLSYLSRLAVQELKIDRSFVAGLPGRGDATVIASVVGLAHQLGMTTVAEGVESDEQLAGVRRLGCDKVQGYLLGRPMPADEVDRYLGSLQAT